MEASLSNSPPNAPVPSMMAVQRVGANLSRVDGERSDGLAELVEASWQAACNFRHVLAKAFNSQSDA